MTFDVRVERSPGVSGVARVPGSKSHTNRALVVAALADGTSVVGDGLAGDDADAMVSGLRALGIDVHELASPGDAPSWRVAGRGGALTPARVEVDARLSGTTARFLTAVAALTTVEVVVTGAPPLLARPIGPLADALRACGAVVEGGRLPLVVRRAPGPLGTDGVVAVDASTSSQFVSALLLVAPYFARGAAVDAGSTLGAAGFVDLTVALMRRRGIVVETPRPGLYRVPGDQAYTAEDELVPGDASAAAHLFTLAAATGGAVTVANLAGAERQPDLGVLDVFEAFGARVVRDPSGAVTVGGAASLRPVDVDLRGAPDQLPNVAVLAALADGRSVIRGVGVTRFHETDRMAAVAAELGKAGVRVDLDALEDAVVVDGGTGRGGAAVDTHDDHRLAMAFAAFAAAVGDTVVRGADCVAKTYRDFWRDAAALGLDWSTA